MKTIVYIDGFNLYYGCLKNTPHKWLNLEQMCDRLLPKSDIVKIRYFTARVKDRIGKPGQAERQNFYLRALATLPRVRVHEGHFLSHKVTMPTADSWMKQRLDYVNVMKTEEKGSDVNLASHLLLDAAHDKFDFAAIIWNDSDLLTPVLMVQRNFSKKVAIINPHKKAAAVWKNQVSFIKQLRPGPLADCQFDQYVEDDQGTFRKPKSW